MILNLYDLGENNSDVMLTEFASIFVNFGCESAN